MNLVNVEVFHLTLYVCFVSIVVLSVGGCLLTDI